MSITLHSHNMCLWQECFKSTLSKFPVYNIGLIPIATLVSTRWSQKNSSYLTEFSSLQTVTPYFPSFLAYSNYLPL